MPSIFPNLGFSLAVITVPAKLKSAAGYIFGLPVRLVNILNVAPGLVTTLVIGALLLGPLGLQEVKSYFNKELLQIINNERYREAQAESFLQQNHDEILWLALNIYFEGRGESELSQRELMAVVFNRVIDPRFPSTIETVVREGEGQPGSQFSWTSDGKSDRPEEMGVYIKIYLLSRRVMKERYLGTFIDTTGGALWYHASNAVLSPKSEAFFASLEFIKPSDNHLLFRDNKNKPEGAVKIAEK